MKLLGGGGAGGIIGGANKIAQTFLGSKVDRDAGEHTENMAFLQGAANSMLPRTNRTWWDSIVDGINRLVRPIFTGGVIYVFWYCIHDPEGFSYSMVALGQMPVQGWWLAFSIVGFWFGGKFIGKDIRLPKPISPAALAEVMKAKREYEDSRPVQQHIPDEDSIFTAIRNRVKDLDPEAALNELLGKKEKTNDT